MKDRGGKVNKSNIIISYKSYTKGKGSKVLETFVFARNVLCG